MTIIDLTEQQMQDTCPSFCERTEHENMNTAEAPVIIHSTGDYNVHGVVIQISTATDDKGEEVDDCALSVFINGRQYSLQEAWDIGNALLAYVGQAELSHPYVRGCLERRGAVAAARAGQRLREILALRSRTDRKVPRSMA
jgi:hypothetical protein